MASPFGKRVVWKLHSIRHGLAAFSVQRLPGLGGEGACGIEQPGAVDLDGNDSRAVGSEFNHRSRQDADLHFNSFHRLSSSTMLWGLPTGLRLGGFFSE